MTDSRLPEYHGAEYAQSRSVATSPVVLKVVILTIILRNILSFAMQTVPFYRTV